MSEERPERPLPQRHPRIATTEPVRVGNATYLIGVLQSECGTVARWPVPGGPLPVTGLFVNIGVCSIEVTLAGAVPPNKVAIPSRAGHVGVWTSGCLTHLEQ